MNEAEDDTYFKLYCQNELDMSEAEFQEMMSHKAPSMEKEETPNTDVLNEFFS